MADSLIARKKTVLIASDIFGISDVFLSLIEDINIADHCVVVSPYHELQSHFKDEQQAYQYFQCHGGIDAYILRLTKTLKSHVDIKNVVGFSAGAAALYKVMSNESDKNIKLTLFYPGQIRYFLNKYPNNQCHIIFPESEPHFSLPCVIKVLKQQLQLKIEQNSYQHGFMNKYSKGFDQTAYNYYCHILNMQLAKK